jgi:hypothetical protein
MGDLVIFKRPGGSARDAEQERACPLAPHLTALARQRAACSGTPPTPDALTGRCRGPILRSLKYGATYIPGYDKGRRWREPRQSDRATARPFSYYIKLSAMTLLVATLLLKDSHPVVHPIVSHGVSHHQLSRGSQQNLARSLASWEEPSSIAFRPA